VRPITVIHALGDTPITAWRPRSASEALAYSTPAAKEKAKYAPAIWSLIPDFSASCDKRHHCGDGPHLAFVP
jgi:hypothetical protein